MVASFFVYMSRITNEIKQRKQAAEDYLSTKRASWDSYEKLFHNQVDDSLSEDTKSQVFDPKLSTLVIERSYRVMAQLALGKCKPISKNDAGSSELMNLIVDKYINVNANAQFDLLTKFRMVNMYSNIYGNFFVLVDWDVKKNGYIGPDMWLLDIRNIFPQVGAMSLEDSDYVIVRTWKPLSFFEDLAKRKSDGFKNITEIVTKLKEKSGSKQNRSDDEKSEREKSEYPSGDAAKGKGYFEVLSQFEGDRWADYCVDADLEFRDTKNPHDNGEIPLVCKYSIPVLNDQMGMGDFERGYSMQQVINSNWNLYLDAVKMSIFPPVILNKDNMAVPSSFSYIPAAKWMARENVNNVAQVMQLNPQGISTFNNTYQVANGSLLNLFGTTDTTVTSKTEAGFGKTPQALEMQQRRENARDNADKFFQEQFLKKVYTKMVNLFSKKQSSAVTLRLLKPEIEDLARNYPEVRDMYDEKTGKLSINKKYTGSQKYDWEIISGSTFATDQKTQQENLLSMFQLFAANPQVGAQIMQLLDSQGYELKIGEMFKKIMSGSGIQGWEKILVEKTPQEISEGVFDQYKQQLEAAMLQAKGQTMQQTPPVPNNGGDLAMPGGNQGAL